MGDRYRYPRPRSPTYNPARASLPINISGWASDHHHDHHEHHLHAVPSSRREVKPIGPRTGLNSTATPGTVTTYKIKADPVRAPSRTRRSTLDSSARPPPIITTNRQLQRPVIHSGGGRPASPLRNPYRSSEEDYYSQPASSKHGRYHAKRHSATMDNADMSRLARDRDRDRLRVGSSREGGLYPGSRSRQGPIYPNTSTRRSNVDEYGEEGYGYTGPKDLVQYDLSHNTPRHARSNSIEGGRSRPAFNDFAPRSFDTRERGPPPSTRGFDRIARGQTWDQQPQGRAPALMDPVQRPAPFEPMEPIRRSNSARPQSMYHDNRDARRTSKDDYYEVRDDDRHRQSIRQEPYDDAVEQRGFGIRPDRPERSPRSDWPERDRDRYDRDYPDDDRGDHKGRNSLSTGLGIGSIAGAALGLGAAKSRGDRDDRDDRDDRRRRDYENYEEARRRRDVDERDLNETGGRESKDRRYWDDEGGNSSARDGPLPPKISPPRDSRDMRDAPPYSSADPTFLAVGRDPKERPSSRDGITSGRRERRSRTYDLNGTAIDSLSDGSTAEDGAPRSRRGSRNRRESASKPAAFNPKDAADLKGLRDAINAKDAAEAAAIPPKIPPKEPLTENRSPRGSLTKDPREVAEIRADLDERRPREPLQPQDNRQLRVVSPPRDKTDLKPVKGILKQSRTAFPEDPDPIREGVAPLKDAKKDGVPPDARWTKIARKLVNPEALELGKERYEAREDFVIVLRVLSREEVQGYAEVTQRIRAAREEDEERERAERHRARRERRERHKREGGGGELPRSERRHRHHRRSRAYDPESSSESDTTEDEDDDRVHDAPRMLEAPSSRKKPAFDETVMSGGLGDGHLPPVSVASVAGSGSGSGGGGRRDYAK